jgi:hypothetical protein
MLKELRRVYGADHEIRTRTVQCLRLFSLPLEYVSMVLPVRIGLTMNRYDGFVIPLH